MPALLPCRAEGGDGHAPGMGPISCPTEPGHAPCQAQVVLPGTREDFGFSWVSHCHLVIHFPPQTRSSPSPPPWLGTPPMIHAGVRACNRSLHTQNKPSPRANARLHPLGNSLMN